MNIAHFVAIPNSIAPEQTIVVDAGERLTYGDLWRRVQRTASLLQQQGVGPADRVAVLDTNSARYVEVCFATALLGAVFVPLNYRAKPPELEHMLAVARPKVLFAGARYLPQCRSLTAAAATQLLALASGVDGVPGLDDLLPADFDEVEPVDGDEATAILMFTSGTTSLPKAALLTHDDFTAYVCNQVDMADGSDRGASLICAPLYHIAAATNVMTSLFSGRRLILLPQFHPEEWLAAVQREGVTHAFLVPTMVKQLLERDDFERFDLSSLEQLAYGGAPMPLPVIRRAIERFPANVGFVNAFGQTETTSTLTILGPDDHRLDGPDAEARLRRLQSIGKPLPDVAIRVVGDDGHDVARGEIGELWVRTERVMKGYHREGGVESPLRDGWLPTRDLGWIDEAGYVFLAGRKDDTIIRGGENIAPAEIEAVLHSHGGVEEAAVVGLADEEWGQVVGAAVVPRPGVVLDVAELVQFCRARLASYKVPQVVRVCEQLPHSALGKVVRSELRRMLTSA